jgi:hypothetical protein
MKGKGLERTHFLYGINHTRSEFFMLFEDIYKEELNYIYMNELRNPFPYRDTEKILENFKQEFHLFLHDFNPDFNAYCSTIAGSISYVLDGKTIPQL